MKSEDITAIASSVIAVTLIIGTVVYFQKEGEKKRLRQERIEQMQLRMKKEKAKQLRIERENREKKERYKKYREDVSKCRDEQYSKGEPFDIGTPNITYRACMTRKGYSEDKF